MEGFPRNGGFPIFNDKWGYPHDLGKLHEKLLAATKPGVNQCKSAIVFILHRVTFFMTVPQFQKPIKTVLIWSEPEW